MGSKLLTCPGRQVMNLCAGPTCLWPALVMTAGLLYWNFPPVTFDALKILRLRSVTSVTRN